MTTHRRSFLCCASALLLGGAPAWGLAANAPASTADPVQMDPGTGRTATQRTNPDDPWKRYVSERGRFLVYLPGTPEESSQEETFGDLGKSRSYSISSFDKDGMYIVTHTVIPSFPVNNRAVALAAIEGVAAGISEVLKKDGVPIRKSSNINLGTAPGKEMEFDTLIGVSIVRIFISRDILYVLVCLTRKDSDASESRRKFLDTFRITES